MSNVLSKCNYFIVYENNNEKGIVKEIVKFAY